jgi:hypothetical protein
MRSAGAWLAAALVLAAFAGCRHLPGARGVPACPGPLVDVADLGDDFRWRARARVRGGGEDFEFEVVAEKRGDALYLVGLHALGATLFRVSQKDGDVSVDALPGAVLPVPPENVLRDLQRIRAGSLPGDRGVAVVREAAPAGGSEGRVTIRDTRCGVVSEYTPLSEDVAP